MNISNTKQIKILYVEDDPASKTLLAHFFSLFSTIELKTTWSAEEGLKLAAEYRPDVIFLDINLPCMNGKEALLSIREMESLKHSVIIALSADAIKLHIEEALLLGFDLYITKPIDLPEVASILQKLFPTHDLNQR